MCGICGAVSFDDPVDSSAEDMPTELNHRGRDQLFNNTYTLYPKVFFGHRRLSIIDLSKNGDQPMTSSDGRYAIIYNGEVYNFMELRSDLENRGYKFKSRTDTEVVLYAYVEWGEECITKFNGMFAFAVWDKHKQVLFLARDRYGIKPLYYTIINSEIVFASEIKPILKYKKYEKRINIDAVNEYFTFQNLLQYETMFKDIYLFPQGTYAFFKKSGLHTSSYWNFDFGKYNTDLNYEDTKNELIYLFKKAVERQLVADVPIGSYLSGGMDSGSIALITKDFINPLNTFTCGFDLNGIYGFEENIDERKHAEKIASIIKSNHYEQVLNSSNLSQSLDTVVYHLEDLRLSFSYPNYFISNLASKFVKVCMSGIGGDELFCGYPWRYYSFIGSENFDSFIDNYFNFWNRLKVNKKNFFNDDINDNSKEIFRQSFPYQKPQNDFLSLSLYFEAKYYLHGALVLGDRLAMANTLEERFPFLDNDLVDFTLSIPNNYKLHNLDNRDLTGGKHILRDAMKDIMPEQVAHAKKTGFFPPEENWYRNANYKFIHHYLTSPERNYLKYINNDYVTKILNEHKNGHNHRLLIWSLLSFSKWCEVFNV